jgi:alkyldihydroxyacetonephosphate synthase
MVVSLRFVDGEGQLRHTTEGAIDTTQLLVGSEGMLGVIVDAWLRVEPAATAGRLFRGYWCASVSQGLEAMRKALQAGHQPAVFRLYDPFDSFISGARKAEEGELLLPTDPQQWPRKRAPSWLPASLSPAELKPRLMTAANELLSRRPSATHWLNHLASKAETGCLLIAGVEEANADDANLLGQALFDDLASSLQDLGPAPGQYWFAHRHDVSFKMAPILASGMFVDTMEVSAPWHRVAALYDAVHEAVEKEAFVMAHFSHAYTSGCSIYFTFAGFGADESDCLARYDRVWKAGLSAVAYFGAATTHHHGVGLLKAPWLGHDQPGGAPLFAAARREIDPAGRLNPGKLWEVAQ